MSNTHNFTEPGAAVKTISGEFTIRFPEVGRLVLACKDLDSDIASYGTVSGNTVTFKMDYGTIVVTLPAPSAKIANTDVTVPYKFTLNGNHEDVQSLAEGDLLTFGCRFIRQEQGQSGYLDALGDSPTTYSFTINVTGTNDLPTLEILQGSDNIIDMREGERHASGKILAEDVDGDELTTSIDDTPLPAAGGGDGPIIEGGGPIITPGDGDPIGDSSVNLSDTTAILPLGTTLTFNDLTGGNLIAFLNPNGNLNDPLNQIALTNALEDSVVVFYFEGEYGKFYTDGSAVHGISSLRYELNADSLGSVEELLLEETLHFGIKETGGQFTSATTITVDIHNEYDVVEEGSDGIIHGDYGDLVAQDDGSFEYNVRTEEPIELNNPYYDVQLAQYKAVQALTAGKKVTETFTIETTDGTVDKNNDPVMISKNLTYTIVGTNDAPTVESHDVYGGQGSVFINAAFTGFIKGTDIETADSALKYVLVNDIGTAYAGVTRGTTTTYTTEYGVVTLQRVEQGDFADGTNFEPYAYGYKYKFEPNYDHPAIAAALDADEPFNSFNIEVRDAQGLASEKHKISLPVPEQPVAPIEPLPNISDMTQFDGVALADPEPTDESLIDAGIGRDRYGDDIHLTSPHAAYAGDLIAKGSMVLTNEEAITISKYLLFDANGDAYAGRTSGANSTYVTEYGTVILTKTATGVNYSLSLNKASEAIQALDHNDSFAFNFQISAQDTEGDISEPSSVTFNVTGTNEAPVLSIVKDYNDSAVSANPHLYDTTATGKIIIDDADAGDHFMNQTLTGEAKLVPNVVAEELPNEDQARGTVLVIEGKYGNLVIDTAGNYTYSLAVEGQGEFTQDQIDAVKLLGNGVKNTETFTITTTDRFGASASQNVAFTVTGANDQAVIGYGYDGDYSGELTYIMSGVGRDTYGNIIDRDAEYDPKLENATYTAVPAKTFIPITDDTGDTWIPQLHGYSEGEELLYTGNTITIPDVGKFVFTAATVNGQKGYNLTFTPDADLLASELLSGLEEKDSTNVYLNVSFKDKLGLESERTQIALHFEGSNKAPTMTITIDEGSDNKVSSAVDLQAEPDTTVTGVLAIADDADINSGSLYIVQGEHNTNFTVRSLNDGPMSFEGTYGTLTIMKDPDTAEIYYEYLLDPVEENSALAALSNRDTKEDVFSITYMDKHGANITKTIDINVSGANVGPVAKLTVKDDIIIDAGVGRNAKGVIYEGETSTPTNENRAYAGDLTASGTIAVTDGDRDAFSFELSNEGGIIIPAASTASKITYSLDSFGGVGEDFGKSALVFTKTPSGYNYTLTIDPNAPSINELDEGDKRPFEYIKFKLVDEHGNVGDSVFLNFTIEGSNEAPIITMMHETDLTVSIMGENAEGVTEDNIATTQVIIDDLDQDAVHTFTAKYGNEEETPEIDGVVTIEGKYGTFQIDNTSGGEVTMSYTAQSKPDPEKYIDGTTDERYLADLDQYNAIKALTDAKSATEKFTITVTDDKGATKTQVVTYTVRGGENDYAPELGDITYGKTGTTNAELIAAGYRNDKAYAGDLKATGTITQTTDGDGDIPLFRVADEAFVGAPTISGNKVTYNIGDPDSGDIYGTLVITKASATAKTASYTFTASKESDFIKALPENESAELNIPIVAIDNRGGMSAAKNIELTIEGSNDGPVLSLGEADLSIDAPEDLSQAVESASTGSVTITDPDWADGTSFDWGSSHGYKFGTTFGKTAGKPNEQTGEITVSGTYGNYVFDPADGTWDYNLGVTVAQQNAVKALKPGVEKKESFTLTTTDPDGIKATIPVEFTITGSQDAPVVSGLENNAINVKDALIMPGVGRNAAGLDAHDVAVSANTAYKGDFVAKGSVAVKDFDGDDLTYSMEGVEAIRVSSTANRFETEIGDITITKTATGFNYSLALAPDASYRPAEDADPVSLRALKHGESANLVLTVTVDDGQGGTVNVPLNFTVTGTNDAPVIISETGEQVIDLGYVQAGFEDSNTAMHAFSYSDVDNGDAAMQMSITLNGKTEYFATIVDLQMYNPNDGESLIEGTYGSVYYSNGSLIYITGETDAQKLALQNIAANKVVQDNFSITLQDENGGQTTKVFENKLIGSDIPLGEAALVLNANSTNTTIISAGVGRDARGNDITVSVNPNADNTQYAGDFTASGTIAVPVEFRAELLQLKNPYYDPQNPDATGPEYYEGMVAGNTTTFAVEGLGSYVFTKTSSGYNYVFTANKEGVLALDHGEEMNIGEFFSFRLGDTYAKINIPITAIGTNNAIKFEVRPENNDHTVLEGGTNGEEMVTGSLSIVDFDETDSLTYVLINGKNVELPRDEAESIIVSGEYGNLEIFNASKAEYNYEYTLGVTAEQKAALKAHENFDMQHEKFTFEVMDEYGATTSHDLNFNVNRDGVPSLDMTAAQTATQDSDLYDDEHVGDRLNTDEESRRYFTVSDAEDADRIEITAENGIVYEVLELAQDGLLSSLSIDGKFGTFSDFIYDPIAGNVYYTYTQFVDAPHTEAGTPLQDSLDVRVLGMDGELFDTGKIINSIENLTDLGEEAFEQSVASNDALTFTSTDADSLVLPSVGANNKASAGDITATGKLTGTAFDAEGEVIFDLYDVNGDKIHAENHGIYTKFFSDMGIVTLKQTATGMDYSITLNPEYEGFKELPLGFTTSFPFTLVAKEEIPSEVEGGESTFRELGREDLGIEVTGGNNGPELSLLESYSDGGERLTSFTWDDADLNSTHSAEAIYNKTTYDVLEGNASDGSTLIMGKYGVIVIGLDYADTGTYTYLGATDENRDAIREFYDDPGFTFTDAQKDAYAALEEYEDATEIVQLKVTDEHGAFIQKPLEFTVQGVNDPLELTGEGEKVHTLNEPGAATKAISGFFTYTDADGDKPYTWDMELIGTVGDVPTEWELVSYTASSAVFSTEYGTLTLSNATFGRINYSFKLNDKGLEVQKLAVDDELNISFTLSVGEEQAHLNFIVKGTNDAPTMRHENHQGMTVELDYNSFEPAFAPLQDYEEYTQSSTSGSLNIKDIDNGDHVIMTISSAGKESVTHHEPVLTRQWVEDPDMPGSGTWEEVKDNVYTMHGTYGTLTVQPDGSYTYALLDFYGEDGISMIGDDNGYPSDSIQQDQLEAVRKLAEGKTGKESFTITVEDGNGGKVSQTLTFTVNGTNDAPEVTVDEPVMVYASGYGRDEDGNLAEDPTIKYESQPVSGRIDIKDPDGGTISYTIQDTLEGKTLGKPATLVTDYGTFTFKYSNTGVDYTFVLNNNHPDVIAMGETSYRYPQLPFVLLVSDNKGASTPVDLSYIVWVGGTNNIHDVSLYTGMSNDRNGLIVAPDESGMLNSVTAQLVMTDPDNDGAQSQPTYTFEGVFGTDDNSERTTLAEGETSFTISGTYGTLTVNPSLENQLTYTLNPDANLSGVGAEGAVETFTIYVKDENGLEVAKEVSFTVFENAGTIPEVITVTGDDSALMAAGVGRDENGVSYGDDTTHGTNEEELTPYTGDLTANGSITITGEQAPHSFIVYISQTDGMNPIEQSYAPSVDNGVFTYTTEYGTLTLTPSTSEIGQYDYVFNMATDNEQIKSLPEGQEFQLTLNFRGVNEQGFLGADSDMSSVALTITGSNDAPSIAATADDGDTTVDLSIPYEQLNGNLNITDQDKVLDEDMQYVREDQTLTGISAHDPDTVMVESLYQYDYGLKTTQLRIVGEYGVFSAYPDTGNYYYSAITQPYAGEFVGISQEYIDAYNAAYQNTLALKEGEKATESFTITTTDAKGASASEDIQFNIIGANDVPEVNLIDSSIAASYHDRGDPDMPMPPTHLELNYIAGGVGRDADGGVTPEYPNTVYEAKAATGFIAVSDPDSETITPILYTGEYDKNGNPIALKGTTSGNVTTYTGEFGKVTFTYVDEKEVPVLDYMGMPVDPAETKTVSGFDVSFDPSDNFDFLAQGNKGYGKLHFAVKDSDGATSWETQFVLNIEGTNNAPELTIKALTDTSVTANSSDNTVTWQAEIFDAEDWTVYNPDATEDHPPFIYDIQQVLPEGEESNPVQSEEIEGETTIFIDGNYGTLVFNPQDTTFTYTVDNAKVAEAMANAEGEDIFPISESFNITAKDENGATVIKPIEVSIAGLNTAPVVENITYGGSTITNAELIAAGVGRDAKGVIYEDTTAANENKAYAGDLKATGKIEVSDADKDSYVPVISSAQGSDITVSEAVVKGSTYTFTINHTEGEHSEALGTLVLTKSGTGFNYTFTLSKTSMYIKGLDEGEVVNLNLGVQMVDKHDNISSLAELESFIPGLTPALNFTIEGSNEGPLLVMNHDTDLNVSLGDTTQEGISADTSATTYLDIIDPDSGDTHTFSARFGTNTVQEDDATGLTTIEGKYGTLTIRNVEGEEPSMTYTLATEGPQYEAALALKDGSTKETFTITVTDDKGASKSQAITYTVRGENNYVPVISDIVESNTNLIDDGFGREANGTDSATWNKAYKGDLTASGTIKASDGDKDALSFSMEASGFTLNEEKSTATTKYYDSDYGTLAITSKGAYTFTMNEDNAFINALAHGETMDLHVNIFAEDGRGGKSEPHPLTFTIEGTDDGPSFNFALDPDDTEVMEAEFDVKEGDGMATGKVVIHDVDDKTFDNDSYDYKLSQGKVVGTEDGNIITIEGKYGILIFNTSNNVYQYDLDTSNPDYRKLSEDTELFESFVLTATDPKGISGTQELKFTIHGSNSSPTMQINATTPEEQFFEPAALYKGNIVIDDSDLDGDTLKELMLEVNGQKIDTTKNGTTKIVIEGSSMQVQMEDGVKYTAPGEPLGVLSVTISGNNCSYVFDPSADYTGGREIEIPVKVTDKHGSDTVSNIEIAIKGLGITTTDETATAIEGGQAIVGIFADMSAYVASDWADVEAWVEPMPNGDDESNPIVWTELALPADVNGMGKPNQYFESEAGTIAFFHKTGQYVFNPAADGIDADVILHFNLNFYGDDAHMFYGGNTNFTIDLTNTHAPELIDTYYAAEITFTDTDVLSTRDQIQQHRVLIDDQDMKAPAPGVDPIGDTLTQSIIHNGEVYEGIIIRFEGKYGDFFYDTSNGLYSYNLKQIGDSLVLDPDVREMLALTDGESLQEVFTFSVVDKYNARVEENFTVTINGSDQGPQFVILSGSKDEGVYGTAITGTFTLQDLEDNENVMGEYTLKVAGQEITLANNKSTTISLTTELDSGEVINTGTLTLTKSGSNYKYSFKGDADDAWPLPDMHEFSIEAYAKDAEAGAEPIVSRTINFEVEKKALTVKAAAAKTVSELATNPVTGSILQSQALTGKVTGTTVALAAAYVGEVSSLDNFWAKADLATASIPESFNTGDIASYFTSSAGNLAFYSDGDYRFEPSGVNSVDANTTFKFVFEDFTLSGADATNYDVTEPTFTLNISNTIKEPLESPPLPAPMPASAESGGLIVSDDDEEFIITDFASLYTEEVQGGSGNDLINLDVSLDGLQIEDVLGIDGGDGMDVLLSGVDNLDTVKELINKGKITDMEVIIAGDATGASADAVREELGIVDNDNDGTLDLEANGWTKVENATTPNGYAEYKSEDDETTILVQQTLLSNT